LRRLPDPQGRLGDATNLTGQTNALLFIPQPGTNNSGSYTLVVTNAVSTQSGTTYAFEVATDAGFASKVQTKDNIAEGSGGQTRLSSHNRP